MTHVSVVVVRLTAGRTDGGVALEALMEALMEAIVWGAGVKIHGKLGLVLGCRHDDVCLGCGHCMHSPSQADTCKEI
jgi:hypothetical protein